MEILKIGKGQYEITTPQGKNDLIYAVPLHGDIAFKFIVTNRCGGLAVGLEIGKLKHIFKDLVPQIAHNKVVVTIVGGDNQPAAIEYFSDLLAEFSSVGKELGLVFDITSKVNADIHPNSCCLDATDLVGVDANTE